MMKQYISTRINLLLLISSLCVSGLLLSLPTVASSQSGTVPPASTVSQSGLSSESNTMSNPKAPEHLKDREPRLPEGPMSGGWVVQWVLGLGAVIVLIYVLAYVLKHHFRPLAMTKHIKPVAWLSVGQRERLAVVQVKDKQYLIGITAANITLIDSIDPPIDVETVTSFADHLPSGWKPKS